MLRFCCSKTWTADCSAGSQPLNYLALGQQKTRAAMTVRGLGVSPAALGAGVQTWSLLGEGCWFGELGTGERIPHLRGRTGDRPQHQKMGQEEIPESSQPGPSRLLCDSQQARWPGCRGPTRGSESKEGSAGSTVLSLQSQVGPGPGSSRAGGSGRWEQGRATGLAACTRQPEVTYSSRAGQLLAALARAIQTDVVPLTGVLALGETG